MTPAADAWDNLFAWGDEMREKHGITCEDVAKAVEAVRRDLAERRTLEHPKPETPGRGEESLITFKVTLHCDTCGADVSFENEKPEWKPDPDVEREYNESAAWVAKHQDDIMSRLQNHIPPYVELKRHKPNDYFLGITGTPYLLPPPDVRYIDCPCCEGKIHCGDQRGENSPNGNHDVKKLREHGII